MKSFVEAVRLGDRNKVMTDVEESLKSHLVVFAAEESRIKQKVVDLEEFRKEKGKNNIKI